MSRGLRVWLLYPLSLLFLVLAALRRLAYRCGLFSSRRLPVPVVVVGNITAGGAGKTPVTLYLAKALRQMGRHPGIVSRGYGGSFEGVREVRGDDLASRVGDEPLLLKRRSGCPVFVGRDRAAAAEALLAAHAECDLILCDDGLQHYGLQRDVEIAVLDRRGVMNGLPLPAGPLREPLSRLDSVDAIVLNGLAASPWPGCPEFVMTLAGTEFIRLGKPDLKADVPALQGFRLHALAGIGEPARFFDQLRGMGLQFIAHAFPDHHAYAADDLRIDGDAILTTEKDAVKLASLELPLPVWVLPVDAVIDPDLARLVVEKLNGRPPA